RFSRDWSSDVCSSDLGGDAFAHGADRSQGLDFELVVDVAAAEVVDDQHVPAAGGQMQRRGPAAESVAAQNQYPHVRPLRFLSLEIGRASGRESRAYSM